MREQLPLPFPTVTFGANGLYIPGREGAAATTRSFLGEVDPPSLFPEGGGANGWVPGYGTGAGESFTEVRFDLSEFIGFGDRMRVLLWKPL
ncbi:MAG: hypothetical protein HY319_04310 [Armatimonadetes bacterium]|nr:hypothetical protein [Armatimonadota bacterium]